MLNKLKIKFIIYTMSIFSLIVVIAISGVLYSIHSDNEQKIEMNLKSIIAKDQNYQPKDMFSTVITKRPNITLSFKILEDDQVVGYIYDVTDNSVFFELKSLATQDEGIINYKGYTFKYVKLTDGSLVFVEISEEIERMNMAIFMSSAIGVISLVIIFISSSLLATWALKPIEKSWQRQKEFISDASHELRTPLAVIIANSSLLQEDVNAQIKDKIKFVNYISQEAKRMSELVERLLFLTKDDQAKQVLKMDELNLADLIYESVLPLESVAFEQEKMICFDLDETIRIKGDKVLLQQLIVILVDNAIKYSYAQEQITIHLTEQGNLSVHNIGVVIPPDKVNKLFDRFYRLDQSRMRETQDKEFSGYGLGLSIAQSIAKRHHVKINVVSNEEKGTIFSIKFNKI